MTRYVIVGAGGWVPLSPPSCARAARRWSSSRDRGRQLELLRAGRLRYFTPDGSQTVDAPTVSGPNELALTSSDVLVIATKTQQVAGGIDDWAWQPVSRSTLPAAEALPIVTLPNGLDAERTRHYAGFVTVIGAVVWVPSTYVTDGEVSAPAGPARGVVLARGPPRWSRPLCSDQCHDRPPVGELRGSGRRRSVSLEGGQAVVERHVRSRRPLRPGRRPGPGRQPGAGGGPTGPRSRAPPKMLAVAGENPARWGLPHPGPVLPRNTSTRLGNVRHSLRQVVEREWL